MSKAFLNNSAKSTFAKVDKSLHASEYIQEKKRRHTKKKYLDNIFIPYKNFNKTELYVNLYTKLDLSDFSGNIPVISDLSSNEFPVVIEPNAKAYLTYNIDPKGVLFGVSVCGVNNFLNYLTLDTLKRNLP